MSVDAAHGRPRTLILCFDGTSDKYDKSNTNVVKLYSLFSKDHTGEQLCYYQAGVGTYTEPGFISSIVQWVAKTLDKAIAWYLYQHILDGYRFLMRNYNTGDRVCLFGFSRGAYTARALAGMLHKVGLLSKDNTEQIPFAYQLYASDRPDDLDLVEGFKRTFCRKVPIDFVGVWDTVASTGIIMNKTLPFVGVNTTIRVFRQALALDEHRVKFIANYYHRDRDTTVAMDSDLSGRDGHTSNVPGNMSRVVRRQTDEIFDNTDVKEVWFAGCHANVGGGVTGNEEKNAFSDIPLRWMVREIVSAGVKVIFDEKALEDHRIPVSMIVSQPTKKGSWPQHPEINGAFVNRQKGNGYGDQGSPNDDPLDVEDVKNVKSKIKDQLANVPAWKLLEYIPTTFSAMDENGKPIEKRTLHSQRGRQVPPNPYFHESVRECMKQGYEPRAEYKKGEERYVY
ncbi:hypothetical protein EDB92DRAFT_2087030 [Lactarius akahatsu]|uniref:T6SS Phospholipase effector Tle1-like catalytic domain-containing protein n=1 Tax=Lactarius akahatsu TaxID=416441 RepID=A0AAD4QB86_9AGAM|nr:hypothetical protein EDB92DRAFT_2087030 [Lactarius akahatsu]